jgi:N-acetylmuramoyl-L-alanine amidase
MAEAVLNYGLGDRLSSRLKICSLVSVPAFVLFVAMGLRYCVGFLLCAVLAMGAAPVFAGQFAEALAYALSTRYAPFTDWVSVVDVELLAGPEGERTWRTAAEIEAARAADALPLAGLRLVLDPGHVGGVWAETEGRHFKIEAADFPVREGELVLEVARRVREQLAALGAEVTLLREANVPVNPKGPMDYLELASQQVQAPQERSWRAWWEHAAAVRARALHLAVVRGDLMERARLVNQEIQPDAVVSLHINAAAWPAASEAEAGDLRAEARDLRAESGDLRAESGEMRAEGGEMRAESGDWRAESGEMKMVEEGESAFCHPPSAIKPQLELVGSNHLHVLIFGCLSAAELGSEQQQEALTTKLLNGSGAEELALGAALAHALAEATQLPPARYGGTNALILDGGNPYLLARNLMLLRLIECPVVLLEPYVANSKAVYPRLQSALANRASGAPLADNDILLEYADAVVAGVVSRYASGSE